MNIDTVSLLSFSPTHTSRKIGRAIVEGLLPACSCAVNEISLNHPFSDTVRFDEHTLVVVTVPVYAGKVAPLALSRLDAFAGSSTPVVAVVVYGNRAYEQALVQLDTFLSERGFKTIAAGTFIGEHSYSRSDVPVAQGRPDQEDLAFAAAFGQKIAVKIQAASDTDTLYGVDVRRIPRPKQPLWPLLGFLRQVIKLRKSGVQLPSSPVVNDESLCTHCGKCAGECPSGAIVRGDETHTDAAKCIRCCACVKHCPVQARVYDTPFASLLSRYFTRQKSPQTIL